MRYIEIKSCEVCPNLDHRGGFMVVGYVPYCKLNGEDLPYKTEVRGHKVTIAIATYEIPDSCPLPKL